MVQKKSKMRKELLLLLLLLLLLVVVVVAVAVTVVNLYFDECNYTVVWSHEDVTVFIC